MKATWLVEKASLMCWNATSVTCDPARVNGKTAETKKGASERTLMPLNYGSARKEHSAALAAEVK